MDPYKLLGVSLNPDGSLSRGLPSLPLPIPKEPSEADPSGSSLAFSKDIALNPSHKTWLRLYLPSTSPPAEQKLPLVIYFHGGGFIIGSPDAPAIHNSCLQMSAKIPALILSVKYRLAPEHRLPAAYDDAADALLWARDQSRSDVTKNADPWMKDYADFSNCFLMGCSAGANIAYHLGLRSLHLDLEPLKIAGLILSQPFFGGTERTASEMRSIDEMTFPLAVNDLLWELSLPNGADRGYEYCNPLPAIGKAKGLPRCLVKGFVGDPLIDRMREFAKALEDEGVSVTALMEEEGFHGIELFNAEKAEAMTAEFRSFVYSCGGNAGARGQC